MIGELIGGLIEELIDGLVDGLIDGLPDWTSTSNRLRHRLDLDRAKAMTSTRIGRVGASGGLGRLAEMMYVLAGVCELDEG